MIRVSINAKRYAKTPGASSAADPVLGKISFELKAAESLAIVGPSGVGKSTLLRIAAGLDDDFDGKVERCKNFSVVFQEPTLLPWRRVLKNLTLFHPNLPLENVKSMLDRVGLANKANDWPNQLSLGQQRRLSLARAFLGSPELLIMDEPFVSLDETTHAEMMNLTKELLAYTGAGVLLVTHDRAEAERLTQRLCELRGSPATLHHVV